MATKSENEFDNIHSIFTSDPLHFKSLVNNLVQVETVNATSVYEGILYTVDPVSETVVLLVPNEKNLKAMLIMAHNVKNMKSLRSSNVMIPNNLFRENLADNMNDDEMRERRLAVKEWLTKNMIPIVESGKILKLDDVLTIEPPYGPEQCLSNNEIVLSKIHDMIKSMPLTNIPDESNRVAEEGETEQKRKVKEWLIKNSVPIEDCGKILKLDDVLTIEPPYGLEQCISGNEEVLAKIHSLIKSLPA